jgi:CubicO group peptidase (beta-lactamase class C family)
MKNNKVLIFAALFTVGVASHAASSEAERQGLHGFDKVLQPLIEDRRLPGYFLSIRQDGEKKLERAQGFVDEKNKVTPTSKTIFEIGSMTEPLTATAIMLLVEEGRISLEDRLTDFLPEFRDLKVAINGSYEMPLVELSQPITLNHLLNHSAGFSVVKRFSLRLSDVEKSYREKGIFRNNSEPKDLKGNIALLANIPLIFQPGEAKNTDSVSYDVLARVIEVVSKRSFDSFLTANVFVPLAMQDTHFNVPEDKQARIAAMHEPVVWGYNVPGKPKMYRQSITSRNAKTQANVARGRTGIKSTANDYLKFLDFLLGEESLPALSMSAATRLDLISKIKGLETGNNNSQKQAAHLTGQGRFNTAFWLDTQTKASGVFMTQINPAQFELAPTLLNITAETFKNDS